MFLLKVAEQLVARASLHHPDYYNSILKLRNTTAFFIGYITLVPTCLFL